MQAKRDDSTPLGRALGRELAAARVRKGWTQKRAAAEAGVGTSALRNYELGLRSPTVAQLVLLARTLDESAGAMMDRALEASEKDAGR
jgi:transcriptional regulator with XRE-family HTH domain